MRDDPALIQEVQEERGESNLLKQEKRNERFCDFLEGVTIHCYSSTSKQTYDKQLSTSRAWAGAVVLLKDMTSSSSNYKEVEITEGKCTNPELPSLASPCLWDKLNII